MTAEFAAPVAEPLLEHRYSWPPWDLAPASGSAESAPRWVGVCLRWEHRRCACSMAEASERSHLGGANVGQSRCRATIRPLRLAPPEAGL